MDDLNLAEFAEDFKQTKYVKRNFIRRSLIHNFLNSLSSLVALTQAQTILDAGCGEGVAIKYLSQHFKDALLEGCDIDKGALDIATKLNPGSNIFESSVYNLPIKENFYDLVICCEVLEHLDRPGVALKEITRVSKKYCILSVPQEPLFRTSNFLSGKNLLRLGDDPEHIQHWTKGQFIDLLSRFLKIVKMAKPFPWLVVLCETEKGLT